MPRSDSSAWCVASAGASTRAMVGSWHVSGRAPGDDAGVRRVLRRAARQVPWVYRRTLPATVDHEAIPGAPWRWRAPAAPPLDSNQRGPQMEFTETRAEILVNAWLLAREGKGSVLEDWAEPEAERLCDAGWLGRRTVDATGDTCWFWTSQPRLRST